MFTYYNHYFTQVSLSKPARLVADMDMNKAPDFKMDALENPAKMQIAETEEASQFQQAIDAAQAESILPEHKVVESPLEMPADLIIAEVKKRAFKFYQDWIVGMNGVGGAYAGGYDDVLDGDCVSQPCDSTVKKVSNNMSKVDCQSSNVENGEVERALAYPAKLDKLLQGKFHKQDIEKIYDELSYKKSFPTLTKWLKDFGFSNEEVQDYIQAALKEFKPGDVVFHEGKAPHSKVHKGSVKNAILLALGFVEEADISLAALMPSTPYQTGDYKEGRRVQNNKVPVVLAFEKVQQLLNDKKYDEYNKMAARYFLKFGERAVVVSNLFDDVSGIFGMIPDDLIDTVEASLKDKPLQAIAALEKIIKIVEAELAEDEITVDGKLEVEGVTEGTIISEKEKKYIELKNKEGLQAGLRELYDILKFLKALSKNVDKCKDLKFYEETVMGRYESSSFNAKDGAESDGRGGPGGQMGATTSSTSDANGASSL